MKRILTWVKPTWNWMHVWNYFWAIKPLIELSKTWETFLFIADYHSLTSVHDWETLRQNKFNVLAEYFSLIPDDSNIIIYEQSKIERINDIMWVLTSVTPYSLMLRAHSFKDSQNKNHEINMATFNYPILMAADIITYDADIVPVWKDQIQHIEFARDIAWNFNNTYKKEIFKLPNYFVEETLATIPWTDGRKMSKSYNNFIPLFWSEKEIKKAIMSIVTDDKPLEAPKDPETCNVFALIKLFANLEKQEEIRAKYLAWGYWYWHAKLELLDIILNYFKSPREKFEKFKNNPELIYEKLKAWNKYANEIANKKFDEIKNIIWL